MKKAFQVRLSRLKKMADVKGKKTQQQQKDHNKHIGHRRPKIAGKLSFEYGFNVIDRFSCSHKSPG
ncbi:hypothetical protein ACFLZL_04115 [Thermodesulfobacteriota bacterium]